MSIDKLSQHETGSLGIGGASVSLIPDARGTPALIFSKSRLAFSQFD
jgi:hypothetical protein